MHQDSVIKKNKQREVTQKLRKGKRAMIYLFYFILFFIIIIFFFFFFFFLYSTYRLNLAHIDIPYAKGYSKLLITGM